MLLGHFRLVHMRNRPSMLLLEVLYVIFSTPGVNSEVKEFCVGVSFLEVGDARGLPLPGVLDDRQAKYYVL